jgi:hypothetical protein
VRQAPSSAGGRPGQPLPVLGNHCLPGPLAAPPAKTAECHASNSASGHVQSWPMTVMPAGGRGVVAGAVWEGAGGSGWAGARVASGSGIRTVSGMVSGRARTGPRAPLTKPEAYHARYRLARVRCGAGVRGRGEGAAAYEVGAGLLPWRGRRRGRASGCRRRQSARGCPSAVRYRAHRWTARTSGVWKAWPLHGRTRHVGGAKLYDM